MQQVAIGEDGGELHLVHEALHNSSSHGIQLIRHVVEFDEGVRLVSLPRGLVTPADLGFEEAQGTSPAIHKLEDFLHVARHPDALHDQIQDIWVGVQSTGGDPHHDVRDLPAAVPVLDYLDEDASVAGGGGEVLLPRGVPPPPADAGPVSPGVSQPRRPGTSEFARARACQCWPGPAVAPGWTAP